MSRLLALALLICVYMFAAPACLGQQGASPAGASQAAAGPSPAQEPIACGIIRGTVTDPQGAVVAGASIKVIQVQTGATFQGKSDDEGRFNVGALPFGSYELEITAPGFVRLHITDISLAENGASVPHNAALEVGKVVADIDVQMTPGGETVTECFVCGYPYFSIRFDDLPLRNRDPQRLVVLQSGVTEHKKDFSIAGNRLTAKTALLNGLDNRDPVTGGFVASSSLSALEEFNSDYSSADTSLDSQYGQLAGAQLSAITKGGTNVYHGQALWFLERNGLAANNFFTNRGGLPGDQVTFDQAGGTIGGPVSLPGIFNGKDRVFFFVSYEHTRDFSVTGRQIVAPLASFISRTSALQGPLFRSRLAATHVPLATGALGGLVDVDGDGLPDLGDAAVRGASALTRNLGLGRIDANLGTQIQLNAFYDLDASRSVEDGGDWGFTPGSPRDATGRGQMLALKATAILNPRMVNEFGLARRWWSASVSGAGPDGPQLIAVNSPLDILGGVPEFPESRQERALIMNETFCDVISAHTLRIGVRAALRSESYANTGLANGRIHYSDLLSMVTDGRLSAGDPRFSIIRAEVATDRYEQRYRPTDLYAFATDVWRAGPRRVFNFGLSYNYYSAAIYDGVRSNKTNFAPQLGFALGLTRSEKLMLRGGASMVYMAPPLLDYGEIRATPLYPVASGFAQLSELTGSPAAPGFAAWSQLPGVIDVERQFARNFRTGYAEAALLAIQFTPGRLFTLEAAYNASLAHRLAAAYTPGRQLVSQVVSGNSAAADAQTTLIASDANSIYHSLQLRITTRERHGLVFQVHYTLSKSIDTASDGRPSIFNSLSLGPVYEAGPSLERGLSDFDRRHRVVGFFTWRLGEPGANGGRLRAILGGWQANGIVTYQSGAYVSVYSSGDFFGGRGDFNGDGVLNDRVAYLGSGPVSHAVNKGTSPADGYLNAGLFGAPGTNGRTALGRNVFPSPGYASIDLSLQKKIAIAERHSIQMRIEAFNLANRVNFAPPVTDRVSADFGRIREAAAARSIRFKLAYVF
jgi:hypothetical protein